MSRLGEDIKAGVKGIRGVGETIRGTVNEAADQILDGKQKHPHTQHSQIKNRAIVEKGKTDIDGADEMIARHESKRAGYRQPAATNVDAQHGGEYARPTEGYSTGTTGPAVGNPSSTASHFGARPTEGYNTQPTEGYAPAPAGSTTVGNTATRPAEGYGRHPERYDATTTGHTTAHGTAAPENLHARPTEGHAQPTEGYSQPTGGYTPGTSGPATGNMQETAANRHTHAQPTGGYAPAPTEPTAGPGGNVPGATATAGHAPTGGQQSYNEPRMY